LALALVLSAELVLNLGSDFFKYTLYSKVPVLLVFLYSKLKLLLSAG